VGVHEHNNVRGENKVVSRQERIAAQTELLATEKELTRRGKLCRVWGRIVNLREHTPNVYG